MNTVAITPKSEDKHIVKVFNWSEVHLSEMTCYKIHTLVTMFKIMITKEEDQLCLNFVYLKNIRTEY